MDENSSSAPDTNNAPVVDTYGFDTPDALETELSLDAEQAYVDKVLGIAGKEAKDESAEESDGKTGDKPAETGVEENPTTGDKPDTKPVAPPAPKAPEAPAEPEEAPTLDVSDLWVDVQDREGKTVRITLEEGIPDDFTFKSDKSLYEVMDAIREMRDLKLSRENDIKDWEAKQSEKAAADKAQEDTVAGWNEEIEDLFEAGILDKPKAPPANGASYTPEEIAADPALTTMNGVFDFMKAENAKRLTSGKAPIKSYGLALTMFQKTTNSEAEAAAKLEADAKQKAEDELTKKRGAVVGGTSSPSKDAKGYVYKRGSAKNIYQVDTSDI